MSTRECTRGSEKGEGRGGWGLGRRGVRGGGGWLEGGGGGEELITTDTQQKCFSFRKQCV